MPDPLPPLDAPEHSDAWTFAYLDGELSPEEKSRFEEHLKSHEACREEVAIMRAALPAYTRVLMEDGPPKPIEHYLEIMRAAEARIAARPSTSLGANGPVRPALRKPRWPLFAFGGGFAALASAAAAVFVMLQPVALEPELLPPAKAGTQHLAPLRPGVQPTPSPPPPLLPLTAVVRAGKLRVTIPREPSDDYTAVGLIDSAGTLWLVQSALKPDPTCAPKCGTLTRVIALDKLPPGPLTVGALVAPLPVSDDGFASWLRPPPGEEPHGFTPRAFGIVKVDR